MAVGGGQVKDELKEKEGKKIDVFSYKYIKKIIIKNKIEERKKKSTEMEAKLAAEA